MLTKFTTTGVLVMASIEVTRNELIVRMHGWDKVWAMRSSVRIPLARVRGVRAKPAEAHFDDVIVESTRGIGTYMPHRIAAGLVHLPDGPAFYAVHNPTRAIAIDLEADAMRLVVIEVDDERPEDAVSRIQNALSVR
jgi:hypothetical protein